MKCLYCKQECIDIPTSWFLCENHPCQVTFTFLNNNLYIISFQLPHDYVAHIHVYPDKRFVLYKKAEDMYLDNEKIFDFDSVPDNIAPENIWNKIKLYLAFQ